MPNFFDDSHISRQNIVIQYLTKDLLKEAWMFVQKSGICITGDEFSRYVLSFKDEYSYKFAAIALSKQEIIGFALFTDLDEEVFLNHLYVCPSRRFQGVGSKLFNQAKQCAGSRKITYFDTSNNFMPWMGTLPMSDKTKLAYTLGSFYQ